MPIAKRHFCLGLLLLLLVSHVSVAAHVATHTPGELGECELCISYGSSTAAIAACHDQDVPPVTAADPVAADDAPIHSATFLVVHPRGPPLSS